jgi:cytochrome c-type biogenesis protein CcsB
LIFSFWNALSKKQNVLNTIVKYILWILIVLLFLVFFMHTYALALRWYITGHAPWSNGYEALTFIAWGGVLAGFLFIRSSRITLAGTALLAFFTLMTAGHSSFDPQLTDLQPVLKSYWLVIHVACITISYGFLGLGFILGLINVINYIFLKPRNKNLKMIISELTYVNEMTLTIGLALATIGTFLGGIWANESWGRYWGWDAKETWALVIVLTYAIVLHFRLIPGLKSKFTFNVASVLAFSSVLMTFIGVNYYLSKGLHSYARGETPVFPIWAWITIFSIFGLIILGWYNKRRLNKST